jgi:hydroxymethylbilane synthase
MTKIRIGTRGSPLALVQANETKARLMSAHGMSAGDFEIVVITTSGDRIKDRPLNDIGGKGLFTKEIEEALFAGTIDLAVHSMKDMPAELPQGLAFAAVLPREDARDAFISLTSKSLASLPQGARLGSSSVRRTAQVLNIRSDLVSVQFRGNVETRLRKLSEGVADATFLAVAGLKRLGLADKITHIMQTDDMLPAVAQGIIGIEINQRNESARTLVAAINHQPTWVVMQCERAFLQALDGSCRTPLGGHAVLEGQNIAFTGESLTLDGKHRFSTRITGAAADAIRIGQDAALNIRKQGGSLLT